MTNTAFMARGDFLEERVDLMVANRTDTRYPHQAPIGNNFGGVLVWSVRSWMATSRL